MTSAKREYLKICVIDALKDKRWCPVLQREDNTGLNGGERQVGGAHTGAHRRDWSWNRTHHWVLDHVHQSDDVGSSSQVLKDFNLPFDLLLLDRLEVKKNKKIKSFLPLTERTLSYLFETHPAELTLRIFTTTFSLLVTFMASNTSLYFPRPSLRTSW